MGVVESITHSTFPRQGSYLHRRVIVVYHYDTKHAEFATVVRDDVEAPHICIFKTDQGRYILSSECQYACDTPAHRKIHGL